MRYIGLPAPGTARISFGAGSLAALRPGRWVRLSHASDPPRVHCALPGFRAVVVVVTKRRVYQAGDGSDHGHDVADCGAGYEDQPSANCRS